MPQPGRSAAAWSCTTTGAPFPCWRIPKGGIPRSGQRISGFASFPHEQACGDRTDDLGHWMDPAPRRMPLDRRIPASRDRGSRLRAGLRDSALGRALDPGLVAPVRAPAWRAREMKRGGEMRKTFASILLTVALAPAAEAGSVLAFGARCDGRTDDSASIQAALDAGGVVTFVDGATCLARDLVIHSNTVVALGTTTLELAGLTPPQTWMLKTALGSSNVIISGGTIRGHRLPASGFVNGIRVDGAADMIIEGTKIVDWPTDGVWVGGVGGTAVNGRSTSVRLSGVEIGNCGRSGISITNADGVRIERSYFHDIHGDPGFGVNGEPNQGDRLTRLVLIDSLFVNNDGGAYLQIAKGLPGIDYTVLNC